MIVNLSAVPAFLAGHARVLDRRRYDLLMGRGDAAGVLAPLDGYRNADGGYGWGLEPDLRASESQPGAALHAFQVFEEIAPVTAPQAVALCDWLESVTLPDGGLPFALPMGDQAATAPWWAGADPAVSSLQITAVSAAAAHRVAAHDPAVAAHPWLERATRYCFEAIRAIEEPPHAYVLAFAVRFLDAVHDSRPAAADLLKRLGAFIPEDGRVGVAGGTEDEALRPLDFAPEPGAARALFDPGVIEADLARLAGEQRADGGWEVDFLRVSPAGAMEWRGAATVGAIATLRANSLL
ncbi:hypothetical protein SAMN05421874_101679 [Nonomuraea maritima]|uniref:Uncharacterized protein n=1 Tax=Nonomuraea maritima TaxID=683260 RepID=A0A1G8TDJ7_9ACTN|nr:hypothetical protein [Nonomuraea maritima]SDJ39646.1 hypothetical protein SAMN05421874_101679 [Nonomuraea maritima]